MRNKEILKETIKESSRLIKKSDLPKIKKLLFKAQLFLIKLAVGR